MRGTDPPGLRRLCLIRDPAAPDDWGSGFAVAPDLVLTAAHVVGPRNAECTVTPFAAEPLRGRVIWRADAHDAALVTVSGPTPWTEDLFPLRYGELTGPAVCVTYGYPIVRAFDGAHLHECRHWDALPTTGVETDRYLISTRTGLPRDRAPDPRTGEFRSPWAGLSGAALLSMDESVVLGIVVADPVRYTGSTEALRVSALLDDPVFARLVGVDELVGWPPAEEAALGDGIVRHSDEVRGLAGMRENLMGSRLPFVAPPEDADTHPRRLLSLLADPADDRGVLLVGAAGVGKTRTCFEVGALAEADGWTVLHLRSGDPGVTAEQLGAAIAATEGDVLVIIDYLNECADLSLSALHARVLPDARRQGRRVALLASARTAWSLRNRSDADVSRLFRRIELVPDEDQRGRIRDVIIERLAPDASRILGADRLRALCGTRPAIAMLIAAELQASAERGTLTGEGLNGRPGLLGEWLMRRLAEDGLTTEPPGDDLFADREPPDHLQAISAMIAATPQWERDLLACGADVLGDADHARHLVALLRAMGWLVDTPQGLAAVHDIVADQLLEQSLLRPGSDTPRGRVLDRLLSSALGSARSLARCATNLGRLMRELEAEGRAGRLERGCAEWLDANVERVGGLVAGRAPGGAAALAALLRDPAWRPVVLTRWTELAGPWFERHSGTLPALRLLENGLRTIGPEHGPWLGRIATRMLADRPVPRLEEDHLLCALLDVDELVGNDLVATTHLAFRWLKRYGHRESASFLLVSLLRRGDLLPETLRAVANRAVAWLEGNAGSPAVQYVLRAMLERHGIAHDECASLAVQRAYDLVTADPEALSASFLLAPLIRHPAVPADRQDEILEFTRVWLERHGDSVEARFVLNRLLHYGVGSAGPTAQSALAWLDRYGTAYHARPVILALLERGRGPVRRAAVAHALGWLARHPERPDASYLLEWLLDNPGEHMADAVRYALDWLRECGTEDAASYVLNPLLARRDLTAAQAEEVIRAGSRWLRRERRGEAFEGRFVLVNLLRRADLPEGLVAEHTDTALRWLDRHRAEREAGFVLAALLDRRDLGDEAARRAVAEAVAWLERHHAAEASSYVFLPLLRHPLLEDAQRVAVARGVVAWIDANEGVRVSEVADLLLPDDALPGPVRTALADRAIMRASRSRLSWPLRHGSLGLALEVGLSWLETHSGAKAVHVLRALLERPDVTGESLDRVVGHALDRLDAGLPLFSRMLLLCCLLPRRAELTDEQFAAAAGHALAYLDVGGYGDRAAPILAGLLGDPRLAGPRLARVVAHARSWLADHGDGPHAEPVRAALAARDPG